MANEPRAVQQLERMKINANKYMDRVTNFPDHPSIDRWKERLQEMLQSIQIFEHEAKAAAVRLNQKAGGVNIEVPATHFALKSSVPEVAPE